MIGYPMSFKKTHSGDKKGKKRGVFELQLFEIKCSHLIIDNVIIGVLYRLL
jgi:hypothetical protein